MSFYRRRPDPIRAVRLTKEGAIPITDSGLPWIEAARAAGQLQYTYGSFWVGMPGRTRAAYPGDWIVQHQIGGRCEVLSPEDFEATYESYDPEEVEE